MANNRLYIVDESTGDVLFLASSLGDGWGLRVPALQLASWLDERGDYDSTCDFKGTCLRLLTEHGGDEDIEAFRARHALRADTPET